jgi:hypothetical protein
MYTKCMQLHKHRSDVRGIGEMVFGTTAIRHRGDTFKMHCPPATAAATQLVVRAPHASTLVQITSSHYVH